MKSARIYLYILFIPVLLFFLIWLSACNNVSEQKRLTEGIITFEISYPNTDPGNILAGMLPNEMLLKFSGNNMVTEFNAGMGLIKIMLIANADSGRISQLLKIMNKKYVYSVDSSRVSELYEELPEMTVELTDETKEIAGYLCKKAVVTIKIRSPKDTLKETHNIFYTQQLNVPEPNWCTPFKEIDGVLLEYQIMRYNIEMKFTAKSIMPANLDSTEFLIPDDYVGITKEEMDRLFESFKQSI